ncbi:hypothetical protein BK126_01645 [Paenibacillus sp. FSL H7-0326]|uniref:hypothetical protein n=1 Tax=Paenibacillus sp. FSL H7-0326 TaxID=1921144 RepID=UPI00096ECEE0|nr:hypothetical protein [Paenibacillus sp. FSL H7-0326]OMC70848.1 hypothetical protein BK126_01645 [Paenibacillus sp. FSL H7-0326]
MESGKVHMVNRPKELSNLIAVFMFIALQTWVFVTSLRRESEIFWMFSFYILLCLYYLIMMAWYFIKYKPWRPVEFEVLPDSYRVGSNQITASEIQFIIVRGYFHPCVGIQLFNKKRTPMYMRIKFQDQKQEDMIMKEIKAMAERHQIPVKRGNFRY